MSSKKRPRSSGEASESGESGAEEARMSSGHRAGLHTATSFKRAEDQIRKERAAKLSQMPDALSGKNSETVYRDRRGRKLDMLNEFMRQQEARESAKQEEREAFEWGKGTQQKKMEKAQEEELENIRNEPFARSRDDPRLEKMRKEELRRDDPMLEFVQRQRAKLDKGDKRVYTGPPPPPNRFGIRPGYRWDGVDRGNGFEARVMSKINARKLES